MKRKIKFSGFCKREAKKVLLFFSVRSLLSNIIPDSVKLRKLFASFPSSTQPETSENIAANKCEEEKSS